MRRTRYTPKSTTSLSIPTTFGSQVLQRKIQYSTEANFAGNRFVCLFHRVVRVQLSEVITGISSNLPLVRNALHLSSSVPPCLCFSIYVCCQPRLFSYQSYSISPTASSGSRSFCSCSGCSTSRSRGEASSCQESRSPTHEMLL